MHKEISTTKRLARTNFSSKNSGGFTLIELLVVIAIIGMLSSIVFASLNTARIKGRIAQVQGSMRSAQTTALLCMDGGKNLTSGTITGGTSAVCSDTTVAPGLFAVLPTTGSWAYTMTTSDTSGGTFSFKAAGDSKTITCTEAGCTTS